MTEVTQSLEEGLSAERIASRQVQRQPAYARHLIRLLRVGGARHDERAKRDTQELTTTDHHITRSTCRESVESSLTAPAR
jgi:hypothetical protein